MKLFCQGRLVTGPSPKNMLLSLFLVNVPLIVILVAIPFFFKFSFFIIIYFSLLLLFSDLLLFSFGFWDPGALPRQPISRDQENIILQYNAKWLLTYNNATLPHGYCSACCIIRPFRAHHCNVCDICVDWFDHHCPWIGGCVGKRNYKQFLSYVFLTEVIYASLLIFTLWRTIEWIIEPVWVSSWLIVLMILTSVIGLGFFTHLSVLHIKIILKNMTTYEHLVFFPSFKKKVNPYDKGWIRNIKDLWHLSSPTSIFRPQPQRSMVVKHIPVSLPQHAPRMRGPSHIRMESRTTENVLEPNGTSREATQHVLLPPIT